MGTRQRINPSVHEYPQYAVKLRTEVNPKTQVKRVLDWPSVASFIGRTYDVIARPMMS